MSGDRTIVSDAMASNICRLVMCIVLVLQMSYRMVEASPNFQTVVNLSTCRIGMSLHCINIYGLDVDPAQGYILRSTI